MVLYPNKLPESERVCSGICNHIEEYNLVLQYRWLFVTALSRTWYSYWAFFSGKICGLISAMFIEIPIYKCFFCFISSSNLHVFSEVLKGKNSVLSELFLFKVYYP